MFTGLPRLGYCLWWVWLSCSPLQAQVITPFSATAQTPALGGVTATASGLSALGINSAGLTTLDYPVLVIRGDRPFGLNDFRQASIAAYLPWNPLRFGIQFKQTGTRYWRESHFSLTTAMALGRQLSMGIQGKIKHVATPDFPNQTVLHADWSTQWSSPAGYRLGIHLGDLFSTPDTAITFPFRQWSTGGSIPLDPTLQIFAEVSQDFPYPLRFHGGLAFSPLPQFAFRLGWQSFPGGLSGGLGFLFNQCWQIDLAFQQHHWLGTSPSLSIAYLFRSKADNTNENINYQRNTL